MSKTASRYRELHHITEDVHKAFLEEQGWTEDEYLAGFQRNKAPRDGSARFLEYEALVARELAKGEVSYLQGRAGRAEAAKGEKGKGRRTGRASVRACL